jgi:predicted transposase/invertase (TIGR01784 family)
MARNAVKAKLDIIFKKIFTDKNNEDLLTDFIAYMIDIPVKSIKEIVIQNTEILPLYSENKFSILDLKMKVNDKIANKWT